MPKHNSCNVIGHATRDAIVRYLPAGTCICEICLALTSGYKDKEKTIFTKVVVFGKQAEFLADVCKGDLITCLNVEFTVDDYTAKTGEEKRIHYFKSSFGSNVFSTPKGSFKKKDVVQNYVKEKDNEKQSVLEGIEEGTFIGDDPNDDDLPF